MFIIPRGRYLSSSFPLDFSVGVASFLNLLVEIFAMRGSGHQGRVDRRRDLGITVRQTAIKVNGQGLILGVVTDGLDIARGDWDFLHVSLRKNWELIRRSW